MFFGSESIVLNIPPWIFKLLMEVGGRTEDGGVSIDCYI